MGASLVAFRVDASLEIGTGHVMRCLTLADALQHRGGHCLFLCRPHAGHLMELLRARRHEVRALPALGAPFTPPQNPPHARWLGTGWKRDASDTRAALADVQPDWLVVDHYALDARWEETLRPLCGRLMVLDDLADRPHACALLLDPGLERPPAAYAGLLPAGATLLLGPQYALLRPEFATWRERSLARRAHPALRELLVTMGGIDKDNATEKVLEALDTAPLPPAARITVVMGGQAPWLAAVKRRAARMRQPTTLLTGVSNMAELMAESDLAIGAAGSTSWERCCLGLPSLAMALAANQEPIVAALARAGAVFLLKDAADIPDLLHLQEGSTPAFLAGMARKAAQVTDGRGTERLLTHLAQEAVQ